MRRIALFALSVSAIAGAACAQEGGWSLEGEVAVVSDYRDRGVSLSGEDPALQGGLTLAAPSGLYGYVWSSTIEEFEGADVEVDIGAGYAFSAGGLDWDLGVVRYEYPGAHGVGFWEMPVVVSRPMGPWAIGFTGAYTPAQDSTGDADNRYMSAKLSRALETRWPLTLEASVGHEDGAFADDKVDWSAGSSAQLGRTKVGLAYVDSNRANSAWVASLAAGF